MTAPPTPMTPPDEDRAVAFLLDLARALHLAYLPAAAVEAHLRRAARAWGLRVEVFTLQSLVVTEVVSGAPRRMDMERLPFNPHWNLWRTARLMELSRAVAAGSLQLAEARAELDRSVGARSLYPHALVFLAYAVYGAVVAARVGGAWREMGVAAVVGLVAGIIHFGTIRSMRVDLQKSFLAAFLQRMHLPTLLLGVGVIVGLVLLRRFLPRVPGPLVMVVFTTAVAVLFELRQGGIQVVGPISAQPPSLALPALGFGDIRSLLPAAFSLALVNYASSVLTGRIYADKQRYRFDPNQEFFGQAAANLATAFTQGFPVTASDSRTAVNFSMGGRSQLVGVLSAAVVLIFALFLTPLLENLPMVTLGGIVIVAAVYLMDLGSIAAMWRVRRVEAVLAVVTMLGVVGLGILQGILIAVALALGDLIRRAAHPHDAVLGEREGVAGYHDIERHEGAETVPGLIIYRFDAPLFFANVRHLREQAGAQGHPFQGVGAGHHWKDLQEESGRRKHLIRRPGTARQSIWSANPCRNRRRADAALWRTPHGTFQGRVFRRQSLEEVHQPDALQSPHPVGSAGARVHGDSNQGPPALQL